MNIRTKLLLFVAFVAGLLLTACGSVRIGRIDADPSRYRGRTVRVTGNVTNSFGALGTGGYQIDDGTGKIYVLSTGSGVPNRGSRVTVTGTVQPGVSIMGRSIGTAIREEHHKVRY